VGDDPRVISGVAANEDAAIIRFPAGKALVQTLDFFTPIVNDPYQFGQIAAANALSDVYAMGGEPLCAMNIVCFPAKHMDKAILREILRGGLDKVREAGAVLAGGHSVEDDEIKYGLSVSGVVDQDGFATNGGLRPGDRLLLTKPLGTGILATAVKASWENHERFEDLLYSWAGRLNRVAGQVIRDLGLKGATDVTGFGLGGHALEMAHASGHCVEIKASSVPILAEALELASMGLVPEGSHANRAFCSHAVSVASSVDPVRVDCIFDAQTSGGMVLSVPAHLVEQAQAMLEANGEPAVPMGRVLDASDGPRLRIS